MNRKNYAMNSENLSSVCANLNRVSSALRGSFTDYNLPDWAQEVHDNTYHKISGKFPSLVDKTKVGIDYWLRGAKGCLSKDGDQVVIVINSNVVWLNDGDKNFVDFKKWNKDVDKKDF